jgi:hypothetical protein
LPYDMSDNSLRLAALETLEAINLKAGAVCFSRSWANPVIWSHYAEQHCGLCLGFEIAEDLATPITYSATREPFPDIDALDEPQRLDAVMRMLHTKFDDWRYENEVRASIKLDFDTVENGLFFVDWGEHLRLVEVVVGMRSATCQRELEEALNGYGHPVTFIKARASHTSFEVEADPDGVLNHHDARWYLRRGDTLHPVEFVPQQLPADHNAHAQFSTS